MKKKMRKWIALMAGVIFLGSGAMVGYQHYQYHLGEQAYTEAEELAGVPDFDILADPREEKLPPPPPQVSVEAPAEEKVEETDVELPEPEEEKVVWVDPYADALAAMDFTALRQVNPEVLGWILIPGSPVSYPLMQGEDNAKYLNTTWRGTRSSVGSIFMEHQNSADLSDFNTIIYGHRTANKSMFGSLKSYAKQDYLKSHPYIYITDDAGSRIYAVFAAYEVGVRELTYRLGFEDEADKSEFLEFCVAASVVDTGIVPEVDDQILTLSTCTGRGDDTRWVVQAVLV